MDVALSIGSYEFVAYYLDLLPSLRFSLMQDLMSHAHTQLCTDSLKLREMAQGDGSICVCVSVCLSICLSVSGCMCACLCLYFVCVCLHIMHMICLSYLVCVCVCV